MDPLTCFTCGQEVRWGWRHGRQAWWHREDVDHAVILGAGSTPELLEHLNRLAVARAAAKKGEPEEGDEDPDIIPEPEVRRIRVGPKDDRVPGGVRTITNLIAKTGWELLRLTYARGPYLSARGKVLSISDSIVLGARGPEVDGNAPRRFVVASWRDGKYDTGWAILGRSVIGQANATQVKRWIRGEDVQF